VKVGVGTDSIAEPVVGSAERVGDGRRMARSLPRLDEMDRDAIEPCNYIFSCTTT
jgi:hypothetical protein